ncbi:Laminin N-terminal (Domain VI) [Popillia japonica]|uniref:Laminin N-terminal (Domain VI) n=1 Tax=Popillia japonica TaxID=7064 RepID=A0AAW1IZ17_POPJA
MFEWFGWVFGPTPPAFPVAKRFVAILLFALLSFESISKARAEILTPPYFNLAEGRKIYASATCGEDTEGSELYCKLVGANAENDLNVDNVIQGQFCDYCDPTKPDKMHPPEYAVDGMETWWQSPPLSRGMKYNEVNLTIDLGQKFHKTGSLPKDGRGGDYYYVSMIVRIVLNTDLGSMRI